MAEGDLNDMLHSLEEVPASLTDVLSNNFDVNSQGKIVKTRKKKSEPFTDDENALILQWLENRYKDLYGRAGSSHVAQDRNEAWEQFLDAINELHNGQYNRTLEDLVKRVDNMKTVGEFCQGRSTLDFLTLEILVLQSQR